MLDYDMMPVEYDFFCIFGVVGCEAVIKVGC